MVFEFSRLTQGQSQLLRFSVDSIVFKLLTSSLQFLIAWFVIIAEVTQTVFQICRRILVTNLQDGTILCVLSVHSFHWWIDWLIDWFFNFNFFIATSIILIYWGPLLLTSSSKRQRAIQMSNKIAKYATIDVLQGNAVFNRFYLMSWLVTKFIVQAKRLLPSKKCKPGHKCSIKSNT